MNIITIVVFSCILLAANYLFRAFLKSIKKRNRLLSFTRRYLPLFELIGWSCYLIWTTNQVFKFTEYLVYLNYILAILLAIFVSWYLIRDFVAGVQVKTRFNPAKGQIFQTHNIKGEIKKVGMLSLKIKSKEGGDLIIPYTKLQQESIRLNLLEESDADSKFMISVNTDLNEEQAAKKIEELIINSAWSSYKSKPVIELIDQDDLTKRFEITCRPSIQDGTRKIRQTLLQYFR
jgi:hypothetical protein